jgi:hypothetical protein
LVVPDNRIQLLACFGDETHHKPDQAVSSAFQRGVDHGCTKLKRQLVQGHVKAIVFDSLLKML